MKKIISEYEELFKVKEFSEKIKKDSKMQMPSECTYERLKNDLKNQYVENIDEKISRWINITKVPYFYDVLPVRFYLQAKLLYRDGFYEAAISVSRSICEMICYEELAKIPQPFGDLTIPDKHSPSFSVLKQYLLMPKTIEKKIFEKDIVEKIVDENPQNKDSNFIKSSYSYDKTTGIYHLKLETAKKEWNLIRFFKIFEKIGYKAFELFEPKVLSALEKVWVDGSTYVHVKQSNNNAKEDAFSIIDGIGFVLYSLYGTGVSEGDTVTSPYSFWPDICSGVTFFMDAYPTPEAAQLGYYNLPSTEQINRMVKACGIWEGEWGINGNTEKGKLHFFKEGEYVNCTLEVDNERESPMKMGLSLFGDYFFINRIKGDREKYYFELSFLSEKILIGNHKHLNIRVIFRKIE